MIQHCQAQQIESMLKPTSRVSRPGTEEETELPKGTAPPTIRALFDAEEASLLRYASSLIGRRAVAEEIVQEVFLQLHVHWNNIESPRAWLFRSVRNRVYNHFRDHSREVLGDGEGETQASHPGEDPPEARLLRTEAAVALRQMLGELGETDRQLVTLKYFQGLQYRDISAQTGLSIGNVGYRLHHILKELAAKLRRLGIDEFS